MARLYEFKCPACGARAEEWVDDPKTQAPTCACGEATERVWSRPCVIMPAWMSDSAMRSRARHREWLKTDKAKAMDLSPCRDDDDDYEINSNERPAG